MGLAGSLIPHGSKRWRHSRSAAEAAAEAGQVLTRDEARLLVSAAWVHDIGYHHPAPPTGFHPIDGAELVLEAGWPPRLAALVAHHSEARFMAAPRGLQAALNMWPHEAGLVTDGLVYADMTAAPGGGRVTVPERLADIRRRHRGEAPERCAARALREPHLLLAAARVDVARLTAGFVSHLAFPAGHAITVPEPGVGVLSVRHPERCAADLAAALHASTSLGDPSATADQVLEAAHCLLVATRPAPSEAWA